MATLEKIRSRAGFLVLIIGIALLSFVIGDFLNSGSTFFRQMQEVIIKIDDEKVNISDFQAQINEMTEIYKIQYGETNLPEEFNQQINQTVFENIVTNKLLSEEFDKIGMAVSAEELFDMLQGENISPMLQQMPMFANPNTGQFDKAQLIGFLKSINENPNQFGPEAKEQLETAKKFWLFWEKNIRQQRLQEKFGFLIAKAVEPNSLDAKSSFNGGKTNYDIAFVMESLNSFADSTITVSNAEIKKEYESQKERFKQEEGRSVKYIAVEINPSKEDFDAVEERINKVRNELEIGEQIVDVVNENSDNPYIDAYIAESTLDAEIRGFIATASNNAIYGPFLDAETYKVAKLLGKKTGADSVQISHIMIAAGTETEANKIADSLVNVAKAPNTNFAALAIAHSADQSAQNGGALGWFTETTASRGLGDEFKNRIFDANKGDVFKIKSIYGLHIVKVTDKTAPVSKVKLASVEIKVVPSSKTYSNIYNEINALIASNPSVEKFEAAAQEKGYMMQAARVRATDYSLGTLTSGVRPAIRWVFNNKVGQISEIFETNTHFVVISATDALKAGYAPLSEVEFAIRAKLMDEKRAEKIASSLKEQNLTSLDAYADAMNSKVDTARLVNFNTRRITGLGEEPIINGTLDSAKEGAIVGPLKGKLGVYVYSVINKEEDAREYNEKTEKMQLNSMNMYRIPYQSIEILRNAAKIEDLRYKFY